LNLDRSGAIVFQTDRAHFLKLVFSTASTLEVTGRRSGEAAEGTEKRSFSAVRVDREVSEVIGLRPQGVEKKVDSLCHYESIT
jgi:Ni,Fe-hydrogenase III component G